MRRSEIYLADLDPTREFPLVIHWRKRSPLTRRNEREESRNPEDRASRPSLPFVRARSGGAKWQIPSSNNASLRYELVHGERS